MNIEIKRHSLAHILAQAIEQIYWKENVKLWFWPEIENWFYHDFDLWEIKISDDDLKDIEKKMKNIISQNQKIEQYELTIDEAIKKYKWIDEYRTENLEKLKNDWIETVSFYKNIDQKWEIVFDNLCSWPHIDNTNKLDKNAFCLDKVAWAYWLWDSNNKMLTRIYWFAFESKEDLDAHIKMLEEAKKRDHRTLWKKLKLFAFSDKVWLWLPLWLPAGWMLWKQVEDFWKEAHEKNWYDFVRTPHIWNKTLWETSWHWGFYADSMYPPMEVWQSLEEAKVWEKAKESETFLLKPMNCPFHVEIYKEEPKSYREFPLRWAETGTVYRFEKKWQLNWLTRVRWFTQDDAHIICRIDQVEDELKRVINFILYIFESFWFDKNKIKVYLSLRDPNNKEKYSWNDEWWDFTQWVLEKVAKEMNLDYTAEEWEAAFYWPKLDFKIKDVLWRQWQCSTLQFDFNLPNRFDMTYTNSLWEQERPYMLHRALFWSFERFLWLLIEHYAWVFPLWLAPKQAIIIPVWENFINYADSIYNKLKDSSIRVTLDDSSDSLNKKIRNAEKMHINYIIVVWAEEEKNKTISIRNYKTKEQTSENIEDFINILKEEIKEKKQ